MKIILLSLFLLISGIKLGFGQTPPTINFSEKELYYIYNFMLNDLINTVATTNKNFKTDLCIYAACDFGKNSIIELLMNFSEDPVILTQKLGTKALNLEAQINLEITECMKNNLWDNCCNGNYFGKVGFGDVYYQNGHYYIYIAFEPIPAKYELQYEAFIYKFEKIPQNGMIHFSTRYYSSVGFGMSYSYRDFKASDF